MVTVVLHYVTIITWVHVLVPVCSVHCVIVDSLAKSHSEIKAHASVCGGGVGKCCSSVLLFIHSIL